MACMRLGSKSEALRLEGQTWVCSSGLASDVTIQVGEISFQLHKFPLISRSGLLEKRIGEFTSEDGSTCLVKLDDIPGGAKAFELVAKFCYGMKLELTSSNVVSLRCASEYLEMSEEYGDENLIAQTETFLTQVFNSWGESLKALESCEEVLAQAEEAHVISRCINSLAIKACADPTLFGWPVSSQTTKNNNNNPKEKPLWNGISNGVKSDVASEDWWYEDAASLSLTLYKRLVKGVELRGMKPERVSGSIMFYARKNIPMLTKMPSPQVQNDEENSKPDQTEPVSPSEVDQKNLLEEIVNLLPTQKGVTQTKFLLRLLKTAMSLHASPSCLESIEKRVGAQLEQASLVDLLIPNMGYSSDQTLYDVDCVQRMVDYFMQMQEQGVGVSGSSSPSAIEEGGGAQLVNGALLSIASLTMVAELVDSYLAEIAPDVNVKPPKFQALAAAVPDCARPRYDGFYHAVDIYLKAHPWLTEAEREQICRLMNCQKLSLEASTHAAQNERLPLRVVVQVLFFEQLRLRTQISGWFFVSDNLDSSQNRNQDEMGEGTNALVLVGDVRERVSELEKECLTMRQEIQKLARSKRRWSIFSRMFARPKTRPSKAIEAKSGNQKPTVEVVKPGDLKSQESTLVKVQDQGNTKVVELETSTQN